MSKRFSYWQLLFFFILIPLLFTNCKKINEDLGSDILPPGDIPGVKYDNSTILTSEYRESRIRTKNLTDNFLGVIKDDYFTNTRASVFASFTPYIKFDTDSAFKAFHGEDYDITSVELYVVVFDTTYDEANYDEIEVYRMEKPILHDEDNVYSNTTDLLDYYIEETPLNTTLERINNTETNFDTLKFTFENSLGDELFNPIIVNDTIHPYLNDSLFVEFFNGLYFKLPDAMNEPSFMLLSFYNESSFFRVNFTVHDTVDIEKEMVYTYPKYNDFSATFNSFIQDHSGDYLTNIKANNIPIYQFGGYEAVISLSNFSSWIDSLPIAINIANLILPVDTSFASEVNEGFIQLLTARYEVKTDSLVDLLDYSLYGSNSQIDGSYDSERKAYVFNIKDHLNEILYGDINLANYPIIVRPYFYDFSTGTVIMNDSINRKIELEIWYTDLKEK